MTKYPYTIYYNKKKKFRASVIICTVSRFKEIKAGLSGLRQQSVKDFEVIIVDGRKDEKLDNLAKEYSRFFSIKRVKINKNNLAYSRNQGIGDMSSDIAAFIDDDAKPDKNWIKNITKTFVKNDGVIGVGGKIFSANKNYLSEFAERLFDYGSFPKSLRTITGVNMSLHIGRLRRLKGYKRKKIFNEKYVFSGEETEACFYIKLAGGQLVFEPGVVIYHLFETDLVRFIKKHFSYGEGDFKVMTIKKFKTLSLIKEYISPLKNLPDKKFIVFIIPFIILRDTLSFSRTYGFHWIPAMVIRETAYIFGLYSALLKDKRPLSTIT